ncbi:MAG: ROK family transcriptional regulator [Caldilineae bacterium]|nr:MAG: ROK family transcriptional regulator [Caldilineae bacterium]
MATEKASHARTKRHNKRLVFQTIYSAGQISRAGVARATHLTPPTVSNIVAELLEAGWVREVGLATSGAGKPAMLLSVNADARYLIGVDLANSEFRGAVVNLRGNICHRAVRQVRDRKGDAALSMVIELLDELRQYTERPLLGIGIGTPGLIDSSQGIVHTAVNLEWQDLPLGPLLHERYQLPVYVANDSQAAALGEYLFGGRTYAGNLVVMKVGRGIGAGVVLNGKLYQGDAFGAGEIGHFQVVERGEPCRCGSFGCLETVVSSRALVRQARAIAQTNPQSPLHALVDSPAEITAQDVIAAFRQGDPALETAVANMGRYLGIAAAMIVSVLNPQDIVIAGTLAPLGESLLKTLVQSMRERALTRLAQATRLSVSSLGDDIVILGAAALLLNQELGLAG